MSLRLQTKTTSSIMSKKFRREKKCLQKQRSVVVAAPAPAPAKPVHEDLPVSLPENNAHGQPNKKMRKSNSKENLFNHVDDDVNAYLDAQEAKRTERCENQEDTDRVYSKISDIFWMQDEYVRFQMNNEELSALDSSNVKVYEKLSIPELDARMTLSEYEAYLLKEKDCWNLWKSHGLTRKQYDDHETYVKNCKTLRNLMKEDPEYDVLLNKIQAFEDEIDARANEEETKMNEWFLNFEANNPQLMARILQSSAADI